MIALLKLPSWCLVAVSVLCLFLTMPWFGLQCVIVIFPGHTHVLYCILTSNVLDKFHLHLATWTPILIRYDN